MPRMKKTITIPPVVTPSVNPSMKFSNKTAAEVLGMKVSTMMTYANKLGIRTNSTGYTAAEIKRIRDYQPTIYRGRNKILGTPDQLRALLAEM